MRDVNWTSVKGSNDGGDFSKVEPGAYVVKIINAYDVPTKEYVEIIWDIAEGPHAGHYSDDWGQSHPYAHNMVLSYRDTALSMSKGRLERIAESNPGFDPFAAWKAGKLTMFIGRVFGVNLREEEYRRRDGEIGVRLGICEVRSVQDVRDGKVRPRDRKRLTGGQTVESQSQAGASQEAFSYPWE